jgi:hypothetical protein
MSSNPGSGSGIFNPDPQLEKMLDPDPDPHYINAEPKPCIRRTDTKGTCLPVQGTMVRKRTGSIRGSCTEGTSLPNLPSVERTTVVWETRFPVRRCRLKVVLRIRTRIRIHFDLLDPDPHWEYGSRSRRAKMIHKSEENSSFD